MRSYITMKRMTMKRIGITGLFSVMVCILSGIAAGSASAAFHCLTTVLGGYRNDGATQCLNAAALPVFYGWDLFQTTGAKTIEPGVLCALVEAGEPSLYDGPNCEPSEEHKGESEYAKAFEERPPCIPSGGSEAGPGNGSDERDAARIEALQKAGELVFGAPSKEQLLTLFDGVGGTSGLAERS
jgi:hypothetical protein